MKRRSFIASLAGLLGLPFIAKNAEAKPQYKVACDPVLNPGEPDRHSVRFESTNTGKDNRLEKEWNLQDEPPFYGWVANQKTGQFDFFQIPYNPHP